MANMWDYLKGAGQIASAGLEGVDPQFAQMQASRRQAKQQDLNQQLNLLGKLPEGSPAYQQLANQIMQRPEFQSLQTGFGEGAFTPSTKPPTALQEQQTRATGARADILESELAEKGKPDLWKFLNEMQDIQGKYQKFESTEAGARAQMSLLAEKSPEFSRLSGIFDLPEREKKPLTPEEEREKALIGGKLKLGVQPPEKPTQKIEYWQDGTKRSELVKPSEYTSRVKEIQTAGGTLETPKTRQEQKKIQLELDTMETKLKQLKDKPMAQYVKYYLDLARNAIATFDFKAGKDYNRIAAQLIETIEVPKMNVIDPQGKEWIIDIKEWPEAQKQGWKRK